MGLKESDLEKMRLVAAILEKDCKYHYTHRQLAFKVGTNESKLRVGFKQLYNCTIHEYLTAFRITKVKEMLHANDWPLQVIATHSGFKNPSILIRNFKKSTGLTPLEWKAKNILSDV
jgi:AraC family transcriptional activator of pyochelin receptor